MHHAGTITFRSDTIYLAKALEGETVLLEPALSDIYRKNWDKIADRTSIKKEELDQVEDLADKLVTAAGLRDQAPQLTAEATRDRQAAFTLFINAYNEVRAVIGFLRRKQGDLDTIAPSLFNGRAVAKKKPADNNVGNLPVPVPVPPITNQPNTPGTNPTSAAKVDVSESAPFMH